MSIFLSHANTDADAVLTLVEQLSESQWDVWVDKKKLVGGDSWWAEILKQIRECDVFVFAITPNSLRSVACTRELNYARALKRPILPVGIGDIPAESQRLYMVFAEQVIPYRDDAASGFKLSRALNDRYRDVRPLPDPLPEEPPTPYEYLARLGEIIRERDVDIPRIQQESIFRELADALRREDDESVRGSIRGLLAQFRDRDDTTQRTATDIADLIASLAEQEREAEIKRNEEEQALLEAQRRAEEKHRADELQKVEEQRIADEQRKADDELIALEARKQEEARLAEEERLAEQRRLADETREAEEARLSELKNRQDAEHALQVERRERLDRHAPVGAAAGWFSDPLDSAKLRYWGGEGWTKHVADVKPTRIKPVATDGKNATVYSTLGIVFGTLSLIPVLFYLTGIIGLVFAIIALVKHQRRGGLALAVAIVGPIIGATIIYIFIANSPPGP